MEFSEVVKNRYSCKKFSTRKLDGAKLEEILQAGRLAPTAKNLQEQHITDTVFPVRLVRACGSKRHPVHNRCCQSWVRLVRACGSKLIVAILLSINKWVRLVRACGSKHNRFSIWAADLSVRLVRACGSKRRLFY